MTLQTPVPETLTRQATVAEASQVAGRNGETQWALKLEILDISQFPIPCFMALDRAAQVLKGSTHVVTMRRGKTRQGKEGKYPSEFFWDLTGWDVKAPPPAPSQSPQERTGGAPVPWDAADTQSRISWAQAVNLAVAALGPIKEPWLEDENYETLVEDLANRFYPLIRKGPSPQAEPLADEEWEEHIEPDGHGGADVVREPAPPRKAFPLWDKAKQTDWQYITGVAKDLYQTDQQAFRQLLGKSWAEWVKEHGTSEAAIQAAILRLAE